MHVNKVLFYVIAALIMVATFLVRRKRHIASEIASIERGKPNLQQIGDTSLSIQFAGQRQDYQMICADETVSWASISKACANNRRIFREMM